jgi:hypothetical protein
MILADEFGSCEVAQVKGFDLLWSDAGVFETLLAGFDRQESKIAIGKNAELRLPDANHCDWSHMIRFA